MQGKRKPGRPRGEIKEYVTTRIRPDVAKFIRDESSRRNMTISDFIETCFRKKMEAADANR